MPAVAASTVRKATCAAIWLVSQKIEYERHADNPGADEDDQVRDRFFSRLATKDGDAVLFHGQT